MVFKRYLLTDVEGSLDVACSLADRYASSHNPYVIMLICALLYRRRYLQVVASMPVESLSALPLSRASSKYCVCKAETSRADATNAIPNADWRMQESTSLPCGILHAPPICHILGRRLIDQQLTKYNVQNG